MACKLYEVIDDCTDPAAAYFLPPRVLSFFQRFLTNDPQDIIGDHSQFKHQLVTFKFSGWQPFHIHVCLDLTVVLLTLSMSMVEIDAGQWCVR